MSSTQWRCTSGRRGDLGGVCPANEQLRNKALSILSERMTPQRLEQTDSSFRAGSRPVLLPADNFYLASGFREKFPDEDVASFGPASHELESLQHKHSTETSFVRLSQDFGTPHPILAQTYSLELLSVKPFPASGGEDSRLFGETLGFHQPLLGAPGR